MIDKKHVMWSSCSATQMGILNGLMIVKRAINWAFRQGDMELKHKAESVTMLLYLSHWQGHAFYDYQIC